MSKYLGKGQLETGQTITRTTEGHWLPAAAGIDIHKHMAMVTVLIPDFNTSNLTRHTRKFDTNRPGLEEIRQFLLEFKAQGLQCYGIEATSTYYRPIEYALRNDFKQVLINPYLLKEARKTDAKDSRTIAYVVLTGLFKPNFVLPDIQVQLKTVNRRLDKAIAQRTTSSNAIEMVLTNYNILLGQEMRMLSASGRLILEAIISGIRHPQQAAQAATYYSQSESPDRVAKFNAIITSLSELPNLPQSVITTIRQLYLNILATEQQIEEYQTLLTHLIDQYQIIIPETGEIFTANDAKHLLMTLPGVSNRFAETWIAEMGIDMQRFPDAGHAVSYAGFNPEKRVSADKVTSARTPPGNKQIHNLTIQCAQGLLQHAKADNPLARWGREYRSRNGATGAGHNMAAAAIGKRLIHAAWYMLSNQQPYNDEQYNFTSRRSDADKKVTRLYTDVSRLDLDATELTPATKAKALAIINNLAHMVGADSQFRIVPNTPDGKIETLNLPTRVQNVLLKAEITKISNLVYLWANQTLTSVPGVGNNAYNNIVNALFEKGFIVKTN